MADVANNNAAGLFVVEFIKCKNCNHIKLLYKIVGVINDLPLKKIKRMKITNFL